ncbi:hypothetical protein DPMN_009748 [Dreissena polymorpha]|uniref:Uncharacterized protein n=1 Tax=Dreissena polymorpha TaxID=45954 RepID=A0A9D4N1S4_DREPO|nr:hypothetical protein DPMN_009705 [Dreissena polymorpha]KAH3885751.1 hypothetical protein DPMN_009748 [Dreissena polymorpha]
MEKGDSYNAIAESYVDAVKGITDKRMGFDAYEDGDYNKDKTHRKRESYCEFQQRDRMLMLKSKTFCLVTETRPA